MSAAPCCYCHRDAVAGSPMLGLYACRLHERDLSRVVLDMLKLGERWKARNEAQAAGPAEASP